MPNKDKNIPKRRFKAFENADAWELRKLGEVVYRSNLTSSSKDLPRLEFEDINSGLGTLNKDISQKVDDRKGLEFNEGDVLFGKLRPYLKNWWYAEFKGIALGDFWNLKSDLWHSCFLYTYIQSNSFQLVANDTSGTKMPRSDWNLVAESIAKFPSLPEQEAIGTFFSTLDQQITLHQRKLDKLKSVKQAYLSEMFPAEGECVPKRRFPGFTDDWELRKLNNIADVRDGTHNSPRYIEFGYPLVTSKNIKNGQVNFEDIQYISSFDYEEINKRSKVNINDILMGMIGTVGNLALVREEPKFAIKNVALIKNIGAVNVGFLYHYLGSYVIERQLQNSLDGGTQKFISLNKIRHLDITFPSLPEQEAIGSFFSTLDRHITLHQRKLEKLKNLKKALLNELFVWFSA
ncbi:TPA: restriction endonuclease subunit S [Streptococcus suis]